MSKTFIITISGSYSGVGKTRLAEKLLPSLSDCAAIKVWTHGQKTLAVTEESDPSESPGKDTARFLEAGAKRAYLVRGPLEKARGAVDGIIESGRFKRVLVESNRLALELDGDLSFFVKGAGEAKKNAALCEKRADVVVCGLSQAEEEESMSEKQKETIESALQKIAKDGRVPCKNALALADRLGVKPNQVGKAANDLKIRIVTCQLGCF